MNTREEILAYGLSFPDTYQNAPLAVGACSKHKESISVDL